MKKNIFKNELKLLAAEENKLRSEIFSMSQITLPWSNEKKHHLQKYTQNIKFHIINMKFNQLHFIALKSKFIFPFEKCYKEQEKAYEESLEKHNKIFDCNNIYLEEIMKYDVHLLEKILTGNLTSSAALEYGPNFYEQIKNLHFKIHTMLNKTQTQYNKIFENQEPLSNTNDNDLYENFIANTIKDQEWNNELFNENLCPISDNSTTLTLDLKEIQTIIRTNFDDNYFSKDDINKELENIKELNANWIEQNENDLKIINNFKHSHLNWENDPLAITANNSLNHNTASTNTMLLSVSIFSALVFFTISVFYIFKCCKTKFWTKSSQANSNVNETILLLRNKQKKLKKIKNS